MTQEYKYHARVIPQSNYNECAVYLTNIFEDTDVHIRSVGYLRLNQDWILVDVIGNHERCIELKKLIRRLSRGKPSFVVGYQTVCRLDSFTFNRTGEE